MRGRKKFRIYLSPPDLSGKELENVKKAIDSNWIAPGGPFVDIFENEIRKFINAKNVVALNSGTSAIHLALYLLGVRHGDEVLCQTFTFCASANPIIYLGAIPVFVDSEKESWNIDPDLLEFAIKDRIKKGKYPKAIIYAHIYGNPAKVTDLKYLSDKYEIPLIEDAAEALGSIVNGHPAGNYGDFSILSFNGNKVITSSGGGALITSDDHLARKAIFIANQAREDDLFFNQTDLGFNYRLSNISAAIGVGQMEVLNDHVNMRRQNFEYYRRELSQIHGCEFYHESSDSKSNRWLSAFLLVDNLRREKVLNALLGERIEARVFWKPLHLQPFFENSSVYENGTSNMLFNRGICLPSGSTLLKGELDEIIKIVKTYC